MVTRAISESAPYAPKDTRGFLPPSSLRKIREVIERVFHDIWATLKDQYFRSDLRIADTEGSHYSPLAHRLKSRCKLSDQLFGFFEDNKPYWVSYVFGYSARPRATLELPDKGPDALAIPVVLQGFFGDHIVCFYVEKEASTMEFFDSKGLTVLDRKNERLRGVDMTLLELANKIRSQYQIRTIKENTKKVQKDCYNCGVFVWDFIERRNEDKRWEAVQQQPLVDTDERRIHFAQEIANKAPEKAAAAAASATPPSDGDDF